MKKQYKFYWTFKGPVSFPSKYNKNDIRKSRETLHTCANSLKEARNHLINQLKKLHYCKDNSANFWVSDDPKYYTKEFTKYGLSEHKKLVKAVEEQAIEEERAAVEEITYGPEYSEEYGQEMIRTEGGFLVDPEV